jgi:hypothetical protein
MAGIISSTIILSLKSVKLKVCKVTFDFKDFIDFLTHLYNNEVKTRRISDYFP